MELSKIAKRPVIYTHPRATVLAVCEIMAAHKVGAVVILDDAQLVGIVSERDVVTRVAVARRDPATTPISEVMTARVRTVTDSTTPEEALEIMHQGAFRHLPLVDEAGRVLGMLSVRDLLRERVAELDLKNNDLMNFISIDGPGG